MANRAHAARRLLMSAAPAALAAVGGMAATGLLATSGCAAPAYHEPQLPADHPANPDAQSAPLPAPSSALSISVDPPPRPDEPHAPPTMHHHGGGTQP